MRSGRLGRARRRAALLLAGALAALLCACSQVPLSARSGAADHGREERPEAGPEYDVLVAEEHRRAGRSAAELAAWQRALAKDEGSAFLHRKVAEALLRAQRPDDALQHAERALELAPDEVEGRHLLGSLYRLRSDLPAAERALRAADGQPVDRTAALLLHQIYLEADRPEDSLQIAEQLAAQEPYGVQAKLALAGSYQRLGREAEALALLREAVELDPGNLRLRALLARSLRESGDREGEIAAYREILELEPHHHAALSALADALVERQDVAAAATVLAEIALHHPEDARARLRLGLIYFEQRRWDLAAHELDAFRSLAGQASPEIRFVLGSARRRSGDEAGAREEFESIPEDHKSYPDARLELASIHERRGEFARALEEVERARAKRPGVGVEVYGATLLAKSGDVDTAVALVESLLAQDPDNDELLYNLGLILAEAKRVEESLAYMQRALAHNPDNANALNYVGYTWAERGERLDEAERMIVRALELRPEDGYITDSLGWVYYMRARALEQAGRSQEARRYTERAREQLTRAEALTGGDPVVSEHLGDIHLFEGDKAAALQRYEEAVRLNPRPAEQPQLFEKLERLRGELR